jgi:hypothetical protein
MFNYLKHGVENGCSMHGIVKSKECNAKHVVSHIEGLYYNEKSRNFVTLRPYLSLLYRHHSQTFISESCSSKLKQNLFLQTPARRILPLAGSLLDFFFHPEDRGNISFRNVGEFLPINRFTTQMITLL